MDFIILVDNAQLKHFHNFLIECSGKVAKAICNDLEFLTQGGTLGFSSPFILIDWSLSKVY